MSLINIDNLSFSYPSGLEPIFEKVSFQIDTDWKLGLIGRNGRGKTTLLNLLLGKYEYTGEISSSVEFGYFPYTVNDESLITEEIFAKLCPSAQNWETVRELNYLNVNEEVLYRRFDSLSEGERTKVLLAALFLNENRFLLIDEPTNHLDNEGRRTVAAYLKRKKGFILVSHDRYFLDGCVDHILSINRTDIEVQKGNLTSWMTNFERKQAFETAENERLKKDIGRLKEASARTSSWSDKVEKSKSGTWIYDRGYVGHKAEKMMKRSKAIEGRQQKAIKEKSQLLKNAETAENIKLITSPYHSDNLLYLSELEIKYGSKAVCEPVSFSVNQGERIVLEGKNGSGKSSILKLITGEKIDYSGVIHIGSGLKISYVPQNTSFLKGSVAEYAHQSGVDESLMKSILKKLDFERDLFSEDMSVFSAGQKKKVLIAKSISERANIYIWDEPLNYTDIYSRMQIENLIKEYSPTMIIVEHDEIFRQNVSTKTVEIIKACKTD